jgi:predicted ATPase/DNA-binding winged helix-turn-helix (wHTH) protein
MAVPMIGRDDALAALDENTRTARLVTIIGPGGVGKTRLVTEWATRLGDRFAGGVRVVSLVGERDDDGAVERVAGELGFGSFEALTLTTSAAPTAVVLDNCESAPETARTIASGLLDQDPDARVVATSREALRLRDEHVQLVAPLDVPAAGGAGDAASAPAIELFLHLARAAGASWATDGAGSLDGALLDDVVELVRRLDGLPLAIELAAARMRAITPADLRGMLDRRLDLLARPGRAGDERHGSLRATIDASYQLLPAEQKALLRRMAVFPGPFDLDLVERIAAAPGTDVITVIDQVTDLVDRSLVAVDATGGHTRYRLYDSIRVYAEEHLDAAGERTLLRDRYVEEMASIADDFIAEALERWSPDLIAAVVERFTHLMTAVEWALEDHGPERAYRLVLPLYGPIHGSRAAPVAALVRRVTERWDGRTVPLHAEVLAVGATALLLSGDLDGAFAFGHEAAHDPAGSPLARIFAHRTLGYVCAHRGDRATGLAHLDAALDAAAGFDAFRRELQVSWAAIVDDPTRHQEALNVAEGVAQAARASGDAVNEAWAYVVAGHRRLLLGDVAGAARDADSLLELAEDGAFPYFTVAGHRAKATVLTLEGRWDEASGHWRAAVELVAEHGDPDGLALTLRLAAAAAGSLGYAELADALWEALPRQAGNSVMVSPFAVVEAQLRERHRAPSTDVHEALRTAVALLAPGDEAGASDRTGPAGEPGRDEGRVLRFEACELDIGRHELRRDGEVVKVEPQVFDVLVALADRRGQLVTKNDLLDEVWGDRFVSESALTSRIKAARQAVGDDGRQQRVIKTVHGRGYRFVADVRES